jgi:hypothetical protein
MSDIQSRHLSTATDRARDAAETALRALFTIDAACGVDPGAATPIAALRAQADLDAAIAALLAIRDALVASAWPQDTPAERRVASTALDAAWQAVDGLSADAPRLRPVVASLDDAHDAEPAMARAAIVRAMDGAIAVVRAAAAALEDTAAAMHARAAAVAPPVTAGE